MTDEELKELKEQGRKIVGDNAVVLAALINAKATKDAANLIANKLDIIAGHM